MIVYNNQQQFTRLCSFQEDFVLLQSPLRNNGNQGQQAIMSIQFKQVLRSLYEGKSSFFETHIHLNTIYHTVAVVRLPPLYVNVNIPKKATELTTKV